MQPTSFHVDAEPAAVYAHLMDPESYLGLAPLVVAVRDIHPVGEAIGYVAVERFRLGPFHWDNPIRVTMTGVPDRRIRSEVVSPGGVRLTATVDLAAAPSAGTDVTETVELHAPWFLRSFALRKANEAAEGRATELARRMRR